MKWAASDELTTSTAWMRLAYSCPMRWNTRSAPLLSTRQATPGYFASKDLADRPFGHGKSTAVYQTIFPSFLAASINAGHGLRRRRGGLTGFARAASPWRSRS